MNPAQAWIFFRPSFDYWLSSVHYCEDRFHVHVFIRSSNIWLSYFHSRLSYTLQENVFFKKKIETHATYLQKCEFYKTSYSLFHERFSILQRVGWALDYDWLKCGELRCCFLTPVRSHQQSYPLSVAFRKNVSARPWPWPSLLNLRLCLTPATHLAILFADCGEFDRGDQRIKSLSVSIHHLVK